MKREVNTGSSAVPVSGHKDGLGMECILGGEIFSRRVDIIAIAAPHFCLLGVLLGHQGFGTKTCAQGAGSSAERRVDAEEGWEELGEELT